MQKQLSSAIKPIYLRAIHNRHTGLNHISIRNILAHLFTAYGQITDHEYHENDTKFKKDWDTSLPFETVIDQIENCIDFADAANKPYTPEQVISNAYTIVFNTGLFNQDCKEWRCHPQHEKTWDNFKTAFVVADQDYRQQQIVQGNPYGSANAMYNQEETAHALANLAQAATADKTTIDQLMALITQQATQITDLQKQITKLSITNTLQRRQGRTPKDEGSYCWSHGYLVAKSHNNRNCKNPKPGHCIEATRENIMGGSTYGKPK